MEAGDSRADPKWPRASTAKCEAVNCNTQPIDTANIRLIISEIRQLAAMSLGEARILSTRFAAQGCGQRHQRKDW
jgi:hypothetical protein